MADCDAYINDLFGYLGDVPGAGRAGNANPEFITVVNLILSIHQTNGTVSYGAQSRLALSFTEENPEGVLVAEFIQYFADRLYAGTPNPFDATQVDSITLNILRNPARLEVILNSWGGGKMTYYPTQCVDKFMYAYSAEYGHLLSISYETSTVENPNWDPNWGTSPL